MIKNIISETPLVFTLDGFYSEQKCRELIDKTEKLSYELAPITVGHNQYEYQLDNRNNSRVIVDSVEFSEELFLQLKDKLPPTFRGWKLKGLNERFRFYKYENGQQFKPHIDGRYIKDIDNKSFLTLLLYLSDDVIGGETAFFNEDDSLRFKVNPTIGQVLVFDHNQIHSGEPIQSGIKYVLRTDVMYTRY